MKRKGVIVAVLALAAAVAAAVIIVIVSVLGRGSSARRLQEQLDLGQKYLLEMDYEQAILVFQKAIEIEPRCARAYEGLADAYAADGQLEKALELLESVPDDVDDPDAIREKLEEIRGMMEALQEPETEAAPVIPAAEETEPPAAEETEPVSLYNEYGAVIFEQREKYRDYSTMTEEEKSFVDRCAQAVLNKEGEVFRGCAAEYDRLDLYTRWKEYKVHIFVGHTTISASGWYGMESSLPDLPDGTYANVWVEMRPENGTGYYGSGTFENGVLSIKSSSDTAEEYGLGERDTFTWKECSCSGWQWDGSLSGTTTETQDLEYYDVDSNELQSNLHEERVTTETGVMVKGLREGEYQEAYELNGYEDSISGERRTINASDTPVYVYENGQTQFEDGSWYCVDIGGNRYMSAAEDMSGHLLEILYW